jgi:hypothetical protein
VGRRHTGGCFRCRDRHPDRRGPFVARRAGPRRSCGGGTGLDRSGADHLQLGACWAIGFVAVGGPWLFALREPGSLAGELWRPHPGGAAGPVRVLLPESVGTIVCASKLLGAIVSVRIAVAVAIAVAKQVRIAIAVAEQVTIAVAVAIQQVAVAVAVAIALGVAFAFAFDLVLALAVACFFLVGCLFAVRGCVFAVRGCLFAVCGCVFAVCGTLFTVREFQRIDGFGLSYSLGYGPARPGSRATGAAPQPAHPPARRYLMTR